jgi:hypothetical protein
VEEVCVFGEELTGSMGLRKLVVPVEALLEFFIRLLDLTGRIGRREQSGRDK